MQRSTTLHRALRRLTQAQAAPARALSSGKSRAHGKRVRHPGAIPGARLVGKLSTELEHRGQSIVPAVRTPVSVVNPLPDSEWRVLRGDFVQVVSGPDVGKRGRVLEVIRASNAVLVEGAGLKRVDVPQPAGIRPRVAVTEHPIHVSRVAVVCPQTDEPSRVVFNYLEDGTRVRVADKSGAVIPRPEILRKRRVARPKEDGPKDTPPTVVLKRTFMDEDGLYDDYEGLMVSLQQTGQRQE